MDVDRLRSVLSQLKSDDKTLGLSSKLAAVVGALNNLAGNPGNAEFQTQVSESLTALHQTLHATRYSVDPTFQPYVIELGGEPHFSPWLSNEISRALQDNPSTPAVAQTRASELSGIRDTFMARVRQLDTTMEELSLGAEKIEPGTAEIGFRIPRDLFGNLLPGWIDELREINRIVRAFSELATGSAEQIEIGDISTTDPLIFLHLAAPTVLAIGAAVSWGLNQWKKVEEIRKLRAETARLNETSDNAFADMLEQLDQRIESIVEAAILEHSRELVNPSVAAGRQHEQVNEIAFALRSLVGRIERGMTVEIKFLPPADPAEDEATTATFADIQSVIPTLSFPPPNPAPVIALPREGDASPTSRPPL